MIIEAQPFTVENGLLTGIGKLARPILKATYGERLEQMYADLEKSQHDELDLLRQRGACRPVLETVCRSAAALLGAAASDVGPDARFTSIGGDSLSALTFANLLKEIFETEVPVSFIVSPATDLQGIADHVEAARRSATTRPTASGVHGREATSIRADDLTLDRFLDESTLSAAPSLPRPAGEVRTVLLTGATGFLGRYLALEWLERMCLAGGKVVCVVRARNDAEARERLERTFDSGDARLLEHYRALASDHLEVLAGDKGETRLGLDDPTWARLAGSVDLIVDPAALVNHVLPYRELFGPNVVGTAELIRLALTTRLKQFAHVSTIGVGVGVTPPSAFTEGADVRTACPVRGIDSTYANGYANSKWAGEVLLREAHDLCGLPVSVFRCDMILAETDHAGQLNVPDGFTRLVMSLMLTGLAPRSFYVTDEHGGRQRAHYDGLPVDFVAEAVSTLGVESTHGFRTYHVLNPHDDGVGLDEFVDWLVEAGHPIQRIDSYDDWLSRFETALRALPERQRQASLLPLLHSYRLPATPHCGATASTALFRAAVQELKIGSDKDIPHLSPSTILKYVSDLRLLGLL